MAANRHLPLQVKLLFLRALSAVAASITLSQPDLRLSFSDVAAAGRSGGLRRNSARSTRPHKINGVRTARRCGSTRFVPTIGVLACTGGGEIDENAPFERSATTSPSSPTGTSRHVALDCNAPRRERTGATGAA